MREEEFAACRPLLFALARRFDPALREDCVQAGFLGLMEAARRFDASRGVQFVTYAVPWVLGEMRRVLEASDGTGARRQAQVIKRQHSMLEQKLGREPLLEELSQACGMSAMDIVSTWEAAQKPRALDEETEENQPLLSLVCGENGVPLEQIDLHMALDRLSSEARQLIMLRFYRDKTQKEAALLLGKSQAQVSRLEHQALDQLKAWLT